MSPLVKAVTLMRFSRLLSVDYGKEVLDTPKQIEPSNWVNDKADNHFSIGVNLIHAGVELQSVVVSLGKP